MKGVVRLGLRHAWHHRGRTALLVGAVALALFLPALTDVLVRDYERDLVARAAATPLLAGAKGNRFDLTLNALYFRPADLEPVPARALATLAADGDLAIPVHVRHTARGVPVVGTSLEYFELRGLRPRAGTLPQLLGDVVLGAAAAARLGLSPGDELFSDVEELYDIAVPPALAMHVCGVLAATGTPDDDAAFVDVKTCWVIAGIAHGHADVTGGLDEALVLGRTDGTVRVSGALLEHQRITRENLGSFHAHRDAGDLPLGAVLVVPRDAKAGTLLEARTNTSATLQMVVPSEVVGDLMDFVFRLEAVFDAFSVALGTCVGALVLLVVLLSMRLRAGEMRMLDHIGASRRVVAQLHAADVVLVLAAGAALAAAAVALARVLLPDLLRLV